MCKGPGPTVVCGLAECLATVARVGVTCNAQTLCRIFTACHACPLAAHDTVHMQCAHGTDIEAASRKQAAARARSRPTAVLRILCAPVCCVFSSSLRWLTRRAAVTDVSTCHDFVKTLLRRRRNREPWVIRSEWSGHVNIAPFRHACHSFDSSGVKAIHKSSIQTTNAHVKPLSH